MDIVCIFLAKIADSIISKLLLQTIFISIMHNVYTYKPVLYISHFISVVFSSSLINSLV